MNYFIILLISIHGLIHLMGFIKAFGYAEITQLTRDISRSSGAAWLITTLMLLTAAVFYLFKKDYWWVIALAGVILSQILIILYWSDARFGTIANVIILLIAIPFWAKGRFENHYKKDVTDALVSTGKITDTILTQEFITHLPKPVQRYIIYSGAINKPIISNFKINFEGQIRKDEKSDWMPFTSEQYNFINPPARLFFMKATMKGLPVAGYHAYKNDIATMDIRLLSLFNVQKQSGREMDLAETVTWFNDLCLFAPAGLIDKRITWVAMDNLSSKATFTHKDITISAILYFNTKGELINFISDDRWQIINEEDRKRMRFSTPAKNYVDMNGYRIPSYGEAVWNLPAGDFTYGQFNCVGIQYNAEN